MNLSELVWVSFIMTYLGVGVLTMLVPLLGAPSTLFGVVVPEAEKMEPGLRMIKRSFIIQSLLVIVIGAAAGVLTGWLTVGNTEVIVPVALTIELIGLLIVNSRHYRAAAHLKTNLGWEQPLESKRVASLTFRNQTLVLHNGWYLVHLGIVIVSVVFAVLLWNRIPGTLIMHYDGNFEPDRYSSKGFGSVFMLNIIQLLMIALFIGTNFIIRIAKQELDPRRGADSMNKQRQFRFASSVFIYGLSLLIILLFSYIQGVSLYNWSIDVLKIVLLLLPVGILGSVVIWIIYLHRKGIMQKSGMMSNDQKHWKGGGIFYYNPDDIALFVTKRIGIGWTINYANPLSWIVIGATILVVVSIIIIAIVLDNH